MNVLVFGGARDTGYWAARRLLEGGATVTFLLRPVRMFDYNVDIRHFVTLGKARLVEGEAWNHEEVKSAWTTASKERDVDFVLFAIGGIPSFKPSLSREPPNLCTRSLLNVICAMPKQSSPPRYIVITSTGLTKESYAKAPILLKPLYSYVRSGPHHDKFGAERILAHCCGREWQDKEPKAEIMIGEHGHWSDHGHLPIQGGMTEVVVIRPALLTYGFHKGDKRENPYRVAEQNVKNGYTISPKDVGHFAVEGAMKRWSEYEGKIVHIAY